MNNRNSMRQETENTEEQPAKKDRNFFIETDHHLSSENIETQPLIAKEALTFPFSSNVQTLISGSRDIPWAAASYTNLNALKSLGKYGSWLTQACCGAVGILGGSLSIFAFNSRYRSRIGLALLSMYAAASLLSLIPWNIGQDLGQSNGEDLGMSAKSAGYFSSIYAAVFGAIVQYAIVASISACLDPRERTKGMRTRGLELFSNIPGEVTWGIVYQATYDWAQENVATLATSCGMIATSVAATSILSNTLLTKINEALDRYHHRETLSEDPAANVSPVLRPAVGIN